MNRPNVRESGQTLIQVHQLMNRNALNRAKTQPFSRLIHESERVNQPSPELFTLPGTTASVSRGRQRW